MAIQSGHFATWTCPAWSPTWSNAKKAFEMLVGFAMKFEKAQAMGRIELDVYEVGYMCLNYLNERLNICAELHVVEKVDGENGMRYGLFFLSGPKEEVYFQSPEEGMKLLSKRMLER